MVSKWVSLGHKSRVFPIFWVPRGRANRGWRLDCCFHLAANKTACDASELAGQPVPGSTSNATGTEMQTAGHCRRLALGCTVREQNSSAGKAPQVKLKKSRNWRYCDLTHRGFAGRAVLGAELRLAPLPAPTSSDTSGCRR